MVIQQNAKLLILLCMLIPAVFVNEVQTDHLPVDELRNATKQRQCLHTVLRNNYEARDDCKEETTFTVARRG